MARKKRLVVCFDGTWKSADSGDAETNVPRIARAVSASSLGEGTPQLTLYLRGVGSTGFLMQRVLDGITGDGIDENIRSAYMFLAQNYVPRTDEGPGGEPYDGDRIYVFGFSRGAFTARSLCGFISCTGLLKRQSLGRLTDAWRYYRRKGKRDSKDFCARSGADCHHGMTIDFLGVWDTVGALGVPVGLLGDLTEPDYEFHDTEPSASVLRGCHALAIDEHRDEFVPTLWTSGTGREPPGTSVSQVWFAGAHSDVGGGYAERALADIPLAWMAREAERAGLVLDWSMLPYPDAMDALAPQHDSRQGWSMKDRLTPTYRRVGEIDCDVGPMAQLYIPHKGSRKLRTINESIHPSVWTRKDKRVETIRGASLRERDSNAYAPINLAPRDRFP